MENKTLEEKIINQLGSYTNRPFCIIFNGSFLTVKNKYIRVKAIKGSKNMELMFFVFKAFKKKSDFLDKITQIPSVLNSIENQGKITTFAGIDFGDIVPQDFIIKTYAHYNVLEIKTKCYTKAIELAEHVAEAGRKVESVSLTATNKTEKVLGAQELQDFLVEFEKQLLNNYINAVKHTFVGLKRNKGLQFYNYKYAFMPLLIQTPWIYNPYLRLKSDCWGLMHETEDLLGNRIKPTTLGLKLQEIKKQVGDITINYVAKSEFCKAIGLKTFVPVTLDFCLEWVASNYAGNSLQHVSYIRRFTDGSGKIKTQILEEFQYNKIVSEEPDIAREFVKVTTLGLLIYNHIESFKQGQISKSFDFDDIYKDMQNGYLGYRP